MKPRIFLTAAWHNLLMLNFEIDPQVLQSRVPQGTELDFWNGKTFVSVVGFQFVKTRVLGIPVPLHQDFDEINLRFYVRRWVNGEWRRGVVFIKEIVHRRMIAWVARTVYNENYVRYPMQSKVQSPGEIHYDWWVNGSWASVGGTTSGEPYSAGPDAEATFITEHYWGYAKQKNGTTMEYEVEHPPWKVWDCQKRHLHCPIADIYGPEFVPALSAAPSSAFVADGSPVIVRKGTPLLS